MIRRRLRQHQPEKLAQGKRVGGAPGDRELSIQAFEVADQQQPKVPPRRQAWSARVGVEALAQPFHIPVEVVLAEDLIQSRLEGMRGTARQVWGRHPHRRLLRMPFRLPIAIGDSVVRAIEQVDPEVQVRRSLEGRLLIIL